MGYTKIEVKVPAINRSFVQGNFSYAKPETISANKKMIETVEKNYGKIIEKWAKVFDIDEGIIVCFICVESSGKNAPKNKAGAIGLMQVTAPTVYEALTKWAVHVKVPLSSETRSFISGKTSTFSKWSANKAMSSSERSQIESALTDVDFNIAVGTATLRWLLDWFGKNGGAELGKVIVSYNAGFYGTRNKLKNLNAETIILDKSIPLESRSYVLKMLGVHGFMDLYYNIMNK
jgi:soluble lytic murein transglycosylase-like protein